MEKGSPLGVVVMNLLVGDTASLSREITDDDISAFAEVTGDHNAVHTDEDFARTTRFGRRIAHGMFSASLLSAVLGNDLPGKGSVYLSQTLQFLAPVYPGDTVTARVTVMHIREDKQIVTLQTVCENQSGDTLIRGEAIVLVDEQYLSNGD